MWQSQYSVTLVSRDTNVTLYWCHVTVTWYYHVIVTWYQYHVTWVIVQSIIWSIGRHRPSVTHWDENLTCISGRQQRKFFVHYRIYKMHQALHGPVLNSEIYRKLWTKLLKFESETRRRPRSWEPARLLHYRGLTTWRDQWSRDIGMITWSVMDCRRNNVSTKKTRLSARRSVEDRFGVGSIQCDPWTTHFTPHLAAR